MQLYQKLPLSDEKRHLVVGDIHGRLTTLFRLLDSINYDPANDILYSVGDLVDRGPYSYETIEFFNGHENRHVIMGNHEYMMINPDQWRGVWLMNGGQETVKSIEDNGHTQEQVDQIVADYPFVLDVGESYDEESFRLIHAEFPKDMSDTDLKQALDRQNPDDKDIQELIWGRNVISLAQICVKQNQDPNEALTFASGRYRWTFCGHTPIKQVTRVGDTYFIDTFRSEPRTLSIIDAITKQTYSQEVID